MPQRNVATNFTFEQQRVEINELAADFWTHKGTVDTAAGTYLLKDGTNAFTGASLAVPAAFTINSNSGAGTVTIAGNLQVDGTTTTLNSTTLEIADKNIVLAKGSANDAAADGAGITIDSATDKTFNFVDANGAFVSSIGLEATTTLKVGGNSTFGANGSITSGGNFTLNGNGFVVTGSQTAVGEFKGATIPTVQITQTSDNTDLQLRANATGGLVRTASNKPLVLGANQAEVLYITGTGQVNIGDDFTQTSYKTQIESTDANVLRLVTDSDDANGVEFVLRKDSASPADNDNIGNIYFQGNDDGGNATFYSSIEAYSDDVSNGSENGYIRFRTRSDGTMGERFRIHSGGRISIGTDTAPRDMVHIHNPAANASSYVQFTNTNTGGIGLNDGTLVGISQNNSNTDGTGSGFTILNKENAEITLGTNSLERLRITSEGYLKLAGTIANSDNKLGRFLMPSHDSTEEDVLYMQFQQEDAYNQLEFGGGSSSYNAATQIIFRTAPVDTVTGVERLRIATDGTVSKYYNATDVAAAFPGTGQVNGVTALPSMVGTPFVVAKDTGSGKSAAFAGSVTVGTVADSKGDLRTLPRNEPGSNSAYTAVTADKGKFLSVNSNVTFDNTATWNTGDVITVYNYGSSTLTIVSGTGVLIHYTDGTTASTGNRTLAARGLCTLLCVEGANNTFVISGALT